MSEPTIRGEGNQHLWSWSPEWHRIIWDLIRTGVMCAIPKCLLNKRFSCTGNHFALVVYLLANFWLIIFNIWKLKLNIHWQSSKQVSTDTRGMAEVATGCVVRCVRRIPLKLGEKFKLKLCHKLSGTAHLVCESQEMHYAQKMTRE